jgi:hypothetical protein
MNDDRELEFAALRWWRWDAYEVRDGSIAPRAGAKLTFYNPFGGRDGTRSRNQPYDDLLSAIEGLGFAVEPDGTSVRLHGPEQRRLLDWCAEFGLLGVLPHRVTRLTMAPRWRKGTPAPPGTFGAAERRQDWHSTGWLEFDRWRFGIFETAETVREGDLVDQSLFDDAPGFGDSGALILNNQGELVHEPLHRSVSRFFPSLTQSEWDTFEYPPISSARFWESYAEPVDQFLAAAIQIRDAVSGLSRVGELVTLSDHEALVVKRGLDSFNEMLRQTSLAVIPDETGIQRRQVPKSLIAAFALMISEDLELEHGRALRCANCGRPFVGLSYQATYCSDRCRKTVQMRRYRARDEGEANGSSAKRGLDGRLALHRDPAGRVTEGD